MCARYAPKKAIEAVKSPRGPPRAVSAEPQGDADELSAWAARADGGARAALFQVSNSGDRKPQWHFQDDDDDDDTQQTSATQAPGLTRAVVGETIAEADEAEFDEISAASDDVAPAKLDVLWDVDTCPLPSITESAKDGDGTTSALMSVVQRVRLRLQTACARGAILGDVIAFGEFGSLIDSPLAQALVACGVQVVACDVPGKCRRGGVSCAFVSAMTLRALDHMASNTPPASYPVLVATARPEVQHAARELAARGWALGVAAPLESLMLTKPRGSGGVGAARTVLYYGWPNLQPLAPEKLAKGVQQLAAARAASSPALKHSASPMPKPLPAWL